MNANTVTASNGPTMKYHCTVFLAEKTKRYLVTIQYTIYNIVYKITK